MERNGLLDTNCKLINKQQMKKEPFEKVITYFLNNYFIWIAFPIQLIYNCDKANLRFLKFIETFYDTIRKYIISVITP